GLLRGTLRRWQLVARQQRLRQIEAAVAQARAPLLHGGGVAMRGGAELPRDVVGNARKRGDDHDHTLLGTGLRHDLRGLPQRLRTAERRPPELPYDGSSQLAIPTGK